MDSALSLVLQAKNQASAELKKVQGDIQSVNNEAKNASSGGLSQINSALKSVSMISMATLALGIGAVIGVIGGAISKASEFDHTMNQVSTLIDGDATNAINNLKKGVLELTATIPIDPNELGANAYKVVKAGIVDVKDQLSVLSSSAKLSKAGMIDSAQATDMVTKAMATFSIPAKQAEHVADTLFQTMKYGKNVSLADLQAGFEQIGPVIKQAGFKMEDFSAATAVLTAHGIPASQAQMDLSKAIQALTKPSKEMDMLFSKIGVKGLPDLINKGEDLGTIFKQLTTAAGGNNEELRKAGLTQKALAAATLLGTSANKEYRDIIKSMTSGQDLLNIAFEKSKANVQDQVMLIQNKLNVFLIELGEKILPIVVAVLDQLSVLWDNNKDKIMELVDQGLKVAQEAFEKIMAVIKPVFDYLSEHPEIAKAVLIGLAVVIMATAVPALVAMAVAAIAAAAPFIILVAAVAGLVLAFQNNFLGIRDFVQQVITKIKEFKDGLQKLIQSPPVQQFLKIMKEIGEKILKNLQIAFAELVKLWNEKLQPSIQRLWTALQPVVEVLGAVAGVIGGVLLIIVGKLIEILTGALKPALDIIIGVLSGVIDIISSVVNWIVSLVKNIVDGAQRWIEAFNLFKEQASKVWEDLKILIPLAIEFIKVWIEDKVNQIKIFFATIGDVVNNVFNSIKIIISTAIEYVRAWVADRINAIIGTFLSIQNIVNGVFINIRSIIQSIIDNVRAYVQERINAISSYFGGLYNSAVGIFNGIKSAIEGAFNSAAGTVKSVVNNIIWNINNAIGSINRLIDGVNSIPGVHVGHVGSIGYLATGGRSIEGGRYVVGEHGPEVVDLPRGANVYNASESRGMTQDQRNQSKNVNISQVNIYNDTDFKQFVNTLNLKLG